MRGEPQAHRRLPPGARARTIPNLQASWVKMGLEGATEALRWGVNDLGGTLMEENISRMAGSQHGVRLEPEQLIAAARAAGREPAQRTTLYEIVETYEASRRRWSSRGSGSRCGSLSCPSPSPGPGQVLLDGPRLRRLPHRPPHPRRRPRPSRSCRWCPGHQIVGVGRAAGEGAERFAPGERVGVPWLGWTDGECRYCRSGRENLCDRAQVHRLRPRRRLRRGRGRRRALLLPDPRRLPGPAGGAAALRRADRLPGAAAGRRGRADRLLRLRRRRPHPLPGRASTKGGASSPSPARATTRRRRSRASSAPSGRAPRRRRRRRSSTARSSSRRSGR